MPRYVVHAYHVLSAVHCQDRDAVRLKFNTTPICASFEYGAERRWCKELRLFNEEEHVEFPGYRPEGSSRVLPLACRTQRVE
jgi:hypothetical protein